MGRLVLTTTLRGHSGPVWSLSWSHSGLLATCGADRTVRVWKSLSSVWVCVAVSPATAFARSVRDVAWSTDGISLAAASFEATATVLELISTPTPKLDPVVCLEGHEAEVKSVAYSSSGGLLATCARDRAVWIWEVGLDFDYECVAVLPGHSADVKHVVWHPSVELLVSVSFDGSARVWAEDADDWFCAETLVAHSGTIWDAAFDADGSGLVTVGSDANIIIWRRRDPHPAAIGAVPGFAVAARVENICDEPVYTVDWRKGHAMLAVGCGDDTVRVLRRVRGVTDDNSDNVSTGEKSNVAVNHHDDEKVTTRLTERWMVDVTVPRAHVGDVNRVAWRRDDSSQLASCGDDGAVRIWHYEEGMSDEVDVAGVAIQEDDV